MRNDPKKYLTYRKFVESELNGRFRLILNGTQEQKDAREVGSASSIHTWTYTSFLTPIINSPHSLPSKK